MVGYALQQLKQRQIPELRRKLGVVFQDFKLLPDRNIYNNLEFVLKATGWKDKQVIRKRIEEVLALVGVNENQKSIRLNSPVVNSSVHSPPCSMIPS